MSQEGIVLVASVSIFSDNKFLIIREKNLLLLISGTFRVGGLNMMKTLSMQLREK